jgi:hypothetical protein
MTFGGRVDGPPPVCSVFRSIGRHGMDARRLTFSMLAPTSPLVRLAYQSTQPAARGARDNRCLIVPVRGGLDGQLLLILLQDGHAFSRAWPPTLD